MKTKSIVTFCILLLLSTFVGAQNLPKLKPISEKHMSEPIFPTEKKGKWGYADQKGHFLIKANFEKAEEFKLVKVAWADSIFLAKVKFANKWGVLQRDGTFLVTPQFDQLDDFSHDVAIFKTGEAYGILSFDGQILANNLRELDKFNGAGLAWFKMDDSWGVINTAGRVTLPAKYSAKASEKLSGMLLKTSANGKYGVITSDLSKVILPPVYDNLSTLTNGLILCEQDDLRGLLTGSGTVLLPAQYEEINMDHPGSFPGYIVKQAGLYGLASGDGTIVAYPQYDDIRLDSPSSWKGFVVKKNGLLGMISHDGSVLSQPKYDDIQFTSTTAWPGFMVKKDGLIGFVSETGTEVKAPQYQDAQLSNSTLWPGIVVTKDGKYGLLNKNGKDLIQPCLNTNQLLMGSSHIVKYMSESGGKGYPEPYVYYYDNVRSYSYSDFDDVFYRYYSNNTYSDKSNTYLDFPYWMKKHCFDIVSEEEGRERWSTDNPFKTYLTESKYTTTEDCVLGDTFKYITINRKQLVDELDGFNVSKEKKLSSASLLTDDGTKYPVGAFLTGLVTKLDIKKLKLYDEFNGTDLSTNWQTISFLVPVVNKLDNGNVLLVVYGYLNDKHVFQRVIACLNKKGETVYSIKEDGQVYDDFDHVSDQYKPSIFIVNNKKLLVSSIYIYGDAGPWARTKLYSSGKLEVSYDAFIAESVISSDDLTIIKGRTYDYEIDDDDYYPHLVEGETQYYLASKNSTGDTYLEPFNVDIYHEQLRIVDGFILVSDANSGLLKRISRVSSPNAFVPALRYVMSSWDGSKIVGVNKNFWDDLTQSKWEYIPKVTADMEALSFRIDDVLLTVSPANEAGYSIYSTKFYEAPGGHQKYGIIGFDNSFFTMPAFDEIKWVSDNTVNVTIGSTSKEMSLEELKVYTNNDGE